MKNLRFALPRSLKGRPILWACAASLTCGVVSLDAQFNVPAEWAYPIGSQTPGAAGFDVKVAQVRQNFGLLPSLTSAEALLAGELIDPATDVPFVNLVITTASTGAPSDNEVRPVNPDFTFVETDTVNYSAGTVDGYNVLPDGLGAFLASTGFPDYNFPGLPGATDDTKTTYASAVNLAVQVMAYLELPAGSIEIGVHSDDAIQVAMHPNDVRDVFRVPIVENPTTGGYQQRSETLTIAEAGLYPVRVLLSHWDGDASLEFWTADPTDVANTRKLINATEVSGSVNAWRSLNTTTRPYVSSVSPAIAETGVDSVTPIEVTIMNPDGVDPVLRVNGSTVTYQSSSTGNMLTLTHTPTAPFAGGSTVNVRVEYGGTFGEWAFVIGGGSRKGVMIGGGSQPGSGERALILRLAAPQHRIEMMYVDDDALGGLGGTNVAEGAVLVINSSSVSSGKVAGHNFEELPIPFMNVESANVDDFLLADSPFANGNNPVATTIIITNDTHELAGGLPNGELTVFSSAVQMHRGSVPLDGIPVALTPDYETRGDAGWIIYGIEAGESVTVDGVGTLFTHPARRVHFGFMGDQGAANFTEDAWTLFDAAITWLVPPPPAEPELTITVATGGEVTLSWTESGTLYEAPTVDGTWTPSNVTNGQTIPATAVSRFFQVR